MALLNAGDPHRAGIRMWVLAARPRTLPAALAPVLVAGGLAVGDGSFRADAFLAALVGALAIQVAANFANDASDAARGADPADRIGPVRMVATGAASARAMWMATALAVLVAAAAGLVLFAIAGWVVLAIGAVSIVAMLTYVGGPVPYGYRGFGEASVFVFFGLAATVGGRYVHDRSAPADAWALGAAMGFLAAAILVANNLRDLPTDERAGKRTLAVILGRRRAARLYAGLLAAGFLTVALAAVSGITPAPTGLAVLALPLAAPLVRSVRTATHPRALVPVLGGTAGLQLVVGAILAVTAAV